MAIEGIPTFHWADYLILGAFLAFATLLGLIIGYRDRRKTTSKDFLMGGGDMHYIPVALSMQASFLSAIYILSTPTEVYYFGSMYWWLTLSYFTATPLTAYIYLPIYHRLNVTSAYEYLERRFNRSVRIAGALTFTFMVVLYMAVVLYTPAIALAQVTGLSVNIAISASGVVCIVYTVLGGMKATIWNDFVQMLVIGVGIVILLVLGFVKVGGSMWSVCADGGRTNFGNFNPDPTVRISFWTQTIGGTAVSMTLYSSSQTVIQKFLSIKKIRDAQKSMWVASVTSALFLTAVCLLGLLMYAYYAQCDPILAGKIQKRDQMIPLFVMDILGHLPGLPGLFIAATFSAALSSISGSLNALAAVFLVDFIRPIYLNITKSAMTEHASNIVSRSLALLFGILTIGMGFAAQYFGDLVLQIALSIFGFAGGPLWALLSLGMLFPFVNSWGAMAGLLSSLGICTWIAIGSIVAKIPVTLLPRSADNCTTIYNSTTSATTYATFTASYDTLTTVATSGDSATSILWVYKISYMYYSVIALLVAVSVGIVVSFVTGRAENTDPRLTFQWVNKCCCYCPRSVRIGLRCGTAECDDDSEDSNDSGQVEKKATRDATWRTTSEYDNAGARMKDTVWRSVNGIHSTDATKF